MQTYPEDNTGKVFRGRAYSAQEVIKYMRLLRKPGQFRCPECNGETFWVIGDEAPTGLIVLQCAAPRCHNLFKPMEIHVPQMDDAKAKELGLVVPNPNLGGSIDFDL